jgi:CHAT domain-containing protein
VRLPHIEIATLPSALKWMAVLAALTLALFCAPHLARAAAPLPQSGAPSADQLLRTGDDLRKAGQYEAALAKYQQALPLYQQAKAQRGEARCQYKIGRTKEALRDYRGAINAYEASLALYRTLKDDEQQAWALNAIGWNEHQLNDQDQAALGHYDEALALFRAAGSREGEAHVLHNRALALADQGQHKQAIESFQQALPIWKELGDQGQTAWALNGIGWSYYKLDDAQNALTNYHLALPLFRELNDREGQAYVLHNTALALQAVDDDAQAILTFEQALALWKELDNRDQTAWALNGIGWSHHQLGEHLQGVQFIDQALAIWRALGDPHAEAVALHNLGALYEGAYAFDKAIAAYERALALWREVGDRTEEAWALSGIGYAYKNSFDYDKAVQYYQQSADVWHALGNGGMEARQLRSIGNVYGGRADYPRAMQFYQRALEKAQASGQGDEEAETINVMGIACVDLGQYEKALSMFQQALQQWRSLGNMSYAARALNNIGVVYWNLGDLERSVDYVKQALALSTQAHGVGDDFRSAIWRSNIANYYYDKGQPAPAIDYYQQAYSTTVSLHGTRRIYHFAVLDGLGLSYAQAHDYTRANGFMQQALTLSLELNDPDATARALNDLGEVALDQDDYAQAQRWLDQALMARRKVGGQAKEIEVQANLARLHEAQGQDDVAIADYQRAVQLIETVQSTLKVDELKATFTSKHARIYERLINLLWKKQRFREAFDYAERARARALLDQVAGGTVNFRAGASGALLTRERDVRTRIGDLRQRMVQLRSLPAAQRDSNALEMGQKRLNSSEAEYAELLTELKLHSPEVASLVSVEAMPITGVQQLLDAQTTLVEYFDTDAQTLAFVITRESFNAVTLPVSRRDITETVARFYRFSTLEDAHPAELQQLYAWLIAPLRDQLRTPGLMIVPHGALHYLPFAALTDGKTSLADEFVISTLPSASVLRYLEGKRKTKLDTLLVMGNPDASEPLPALNFAAQEARAIAKLFGAQPLLGKAASESALRAQAGQASFVHLAAHGQFNPQSPLFSTIYLAGDAENDGRLEVHEIYELDLTRATDLVVLSACQTQAGTLSAGEDVVGLSRAFMYAGTPSVIASLWSVDDAATELLMERFYMHLKAGAQKGEALRMAQADVRQTYPHPYYWAGFVLMGSPGTIHPAASRAAAGSATSANPAPDAPAPATATPVMLIGLGALGAALIVLALVMGWRWARRTQKR